MPRSPRFRPRPPVSRREPRRRLASQARLLRLLLLLPLAGLPLSAGGCGGPAADADGAGLALRVPADRYEAAFAAAADVLADHGLSPAVRDRRSGVIETDPEASVGWFAPWDLELASSLEDVATLSTIRRRARVTFSPPRFAEEDAAPLAGPDLLGLREPPADLTRRTAPLDMRVAVFVERSHRPGVRVDTWSRRNVSRARVARPAPATGFEPDRSWWPVARDEGLEQALLAEIARRLEPEGPPPDATG